MKNSKNIFYCLVILISVGYAIFNMTFLARHDSVTTDEKVHIPAGMSYYKYDNFYLNPEHPPLAKLVVGLAPYLEGANYPNPDSLYQVARQYYYDSWKEQKVWGEQLLYQSGNNTEKIVFSARLANIVVATALILFIIFWAYEIGGLSAGALAAVLSGFQPLILAHGHLGNTDILITLIFTLLSYSWWKYLRFKSKKWFILSAILLGLSAITKFTFIIFIPVLIISSLLVARAKKSKINIWSAVGNGLVFVVISYLVVLVCYRSLTLPPPWNATVMVQYNLAPSFGKIINSLRYIMAPSLFFKGLVMVITHAIGGHGSFLLGKFSRTGWWYYFPVTILLKTPVGFLIFFAASAIYFKKLFGQKKELGIVLLSGIVVYLLIAMTSRANLGQRHVLPMYPLMIVMASQIVLLAKSLTKRIIVIIIALSVMISTSLSFNNQIAYFNFLVGGTRNGYKYLLDSNYDWGQSLTDIAEYIKSNNLHSVYLSYAWESPGEASHYGIVAKDFSNFDPTVDSTLIIDPSTYQLPENAWLKSLPIKDRIAQTIFVLDYKVGQRLSSD
jgi:hypothetical protein